MGLPSQHQADQASATSAGPRAAMVCLLVCPAEKLCEVKWALRSTAVNNASGCNEIPAELFKSLKEDAIKVLHSCQQIWKTRQWPQDWKRSILNPIPKKGSTKECPKHRIIAFISHASKVMLNILHGRLQHYVN